GRNVQLTPRPGRTRHRPAPRALRFPGAGHRRLRHRRLAPAARTGRARPRWRPSESTRRPGRPVRLQSGLPLTGLVDPDRRAHLGAGRSGGRTHGGTRLGRLRRGDRAVSRRRPRPQALCGYDFTVSGAKLAMTTAQPSSAHPASAENVAEFARTLTPDTTWEIGLMPTNHCSQPGMDS